MPFYKELSDVTKIFDFTYIEFFSIRHLYLLGIRKWLRTVNVPVCNVSGHWFTAHNPVSGMAKRNG